MSPAKTEGKGGMVSHAPCRGGTDGIKRSQNARMAVS